MEKTVTTAPTLGHEDRQEILDLISNYSYTYDAQDIDAFVALFAEDAEWAAYLRSTPAITLHGREELRQNLGARMRDHATKGTTSRHYQTNTILTSVGEGRVDGITMVLVLWQTLGEREPRPAHTGYYRDTFVKGGTGWKFLKRVAHIDHE